MNIIINIGKLCVWSGHRTVNAHKKACSVGLETSYALMMHLCSIMAVSTREAYFL